MTQYHEPVESLDEKAKDIVRALNSLKEEVEAIDWYNQRVVASKDEELKAIMAHNRDEEIEHVCMTLEWLRRNMSVWDKELRTYLFTEGPVTELEEISVGDESSEESTNQGVGLNVGNLK
ncbi:ferritin-like domain-containing protein [Schnuerera sp. xch1]|uniref:encapsulin-associated ferritin-like protein n=1 Tax=Schnuerera sp. xch1 TaxID=2874283 RepID=UPI001CBB3093|nr:ferritin-like domain-containing protein [Schnuerera sp. xch1]MBZ2173662.1 ferritin-like domain-containing protein [Schnuerera sp. xch1]